MSTVALNIIGRFGNACFQWAHAKAFCEQNGHELRTTEWAGEKIFTLDGYEPRRPDGTESVVLSGYFQNQDSLIYSRADCRRWFTLKPEVKVKLSSFNLYHLPHAHFRRGDYVGSSYPLIGRKAVEAAMMQYGIYDPCISVSDANPEDNSVFPEFPFLHDFYHLMNAPVLFRSNSSFSFWAGVLSHGRVFSPVITGLAGGIEHDNVPFVEGNWAKLAELPNITELHLREQ